MIFQLSLVSGWIWYRQKITIKNYKDYIEAIDVSNIKDVAEIAVDRQKLIHDMEKMEIRKAISLYEETYIKPLHLSYRYTIDILNNVFSGKDKLPEIPQILFSNTYPIEDSNQTSD